MIEDVLKLIEAHERFFISTHIRPDGDAIGSEVALGRFLEKLGKQVVIINSDPVPYNMDWLPGINDIEVFDGSLEQRRRIAEADVLFILDTNAMDRLGRLVDPVRNSGGVKALIDHHTHPEAWFDVTYARDTASSTGELVYEIVSALDPELIDADMASALYAAIMTDTGSFRYSSVSPQLHRTVADILERGGISPAPVHVAVYDTRSLQALRLLGKVLDTITLLYDGQISYIVITPRMLTESGAGSEDTEGFVNYPLSIEGVKASVQFFETEGGTKMSFRSKGDVQVNEWARSFGGGGHRNAAGAYLTVPLQEAIEQVMAAVPKYVPISVARDEDELSEEDAAYLSSLMELRSKS